MNLSLSTDTSRFIEEQVRLGHYPSPEAVIDAAIACLQDDEPDQETSAAIDEAQAEFDCGEDRPFEEVAAELGRRYLHK